MSQAVEQKLDHSSTRGYPVDMNPAEMVASAQRQTASRTAAHALLTKQFDDLEGLSAEDEARLRVEVYCLLFPEYADRFA